MPTVHVDPGGAEIRVPGVSPILFEAQAAGYSWPTICGGRGTCRTCFLRIRHHPDRLSTIDPVEAQSLTLLGLTPQPGEQIRLACQAVALHDVTVVRPGVHPLESTNPPPEPDNESSTS